MMKQRFGTYLGFAAIILATTAMVAGSAYAEIVTNTPSGATYIRSSAADADKVFNTDELLIGRVGANDWIRSLLAFDLAAIPDSAIINRVTLDLYVSTQDATSAAGWVGAEGITLNELTQDASFPANHTWNEYNDSGNLDWAVAGGDFSATLLSSFVDTDGAASNPSQVNTGDNFRFESTAGFVNALQDNLADDTLQFIARTPSIETGFTSRKLYRFASEGHGTPSYHPALTVDYSVPLAISLITNGDFETGDESNWTDGAGASITSGSSALAGTYSLLMPASGGGSPFSQSLEPTTERTPLQTSFSFSMHDPGGADHRGLNAYWVESGGGGSGQINLRVVDIDDDGDGDVQVYSTTWNTILTDVVTFGTTEAPSVNTLTLTINTLGAGLDYDVTVNGSTVSGLSYRQNQQIDDIAKIGFSSQFSPAAYTIDNVSVTTRGPQGTTISIRQTARPSFICIGASLG